MNAQPFVHARRPALLAATLLVSLAGLVGSAQAGNGPAVYQIADIFKLADPGMVLGGATMLRYKQSVGARIAASGLDPGSAYSIWWVVFNNPTACIGGCDSGDLANPDVQASVFHAAGFVTGDDGTANISFDLGAGALAVGTEQIAGTVEGLIPGNGFGAEIHLAIRTHGAIKPGEVADQISSFNASCNPMCGNQQVAIFMPPL